MKILSPGVAVCVVGLFSVGHSWSTTPGLFPRRVQLPTTSRTFTVRNVASASAATASSDGEDTAQLSHLQAKKNTRQQQVREEGGPFAFNTKYGALNPYAIYYGLTAIVLGLPWFVALTCCRLLYAITGGRVDKNVSFCLSWTQ